MDCFVSMQCYFILCTCMFSSMIKYWNFLINFLSILPYRSDLILWPYNDWFQTSFVMTSCLSISTIGDMWQIKSIQNSFGFWFILYTATFSSNNSADMVSFIESSSPFSRFSRILWKSSSALNSSSKMYSSLRDKVSNYVLVL